VVPATVGAGGDGQLEVLVDVDVEDLVELVDVEDLDELVDVEDLDELVDDEDLVELVELVLGGCFVDVTGVTFVPLTGATQ
jgi:hypothetical protein